MGITRIANVTGLDCIGIPVVMVCRPNSRSLSVAQGKGVTLSASRAPGLMESVELFHAESVTLPLRLCSYEELRYSRNVADPDGLPRVAESPFHPNLKLLWCEGRDLLAPATGGPAQESASVWVPLEMVHLDNTLRLPGRGCFPATSNGLASGKHILEAISHGLCEVVERDAAALWSLREESAQDRCLVNPDTVDDLDCRELIDKFVHAGAAIGMWEVTSDLGIPVFICYILPRDSQGMR